MTETTKLTAEETIKGIIASAKAGNVSDHTFKDGIESWKISLGSDTYRVDVTDRQAKTGKAFNKNNLVLLQADGKEKTINLGEWKKKLFYTLVYCLRGNKVFHKIDQDPKKVRAIIKDMKDNPSNYIKTDTTIKGTWNGKPIVVNREKKTFASGRTLYRVTMTECGIVTMKGSQLQPLFKQHWNKKIQIKPVYNVSRFFYIQTMLDFEENVLTFQRLCMPYSIYPSWYLYTGSMLIISCVTSTDKIAIIKWSQIKPYVGIDAEIKFDGDINEHLYIPNDMDDAMRVVKEEFEYIKSQNFETKIYNMRIEQALKNLD